MSGGKFLYPMLGVGSSFVLFLIGLSVGQSLGLPIPAAAAVRFLSGPAGVTLVVQLEQHDRSE